MSDQVAIKTWGNSQGIRIPKNILEKLGLHVSDTLQIEVIDDSIVLKKAFKHKTFEERVAEYNGEISICDYDWGRSEERRVGNLSERKFYDEFFAGRYYQNF